MNHHQELSQRKLEEIAQTLSGIHKYKVLAKSSQSDNPYLRTISPSKKKHNIMYYADDAVPYKVFEPFVNKPQVVTEYNDPDEVIAFIVGKEQNNACSV